MPDDEFNELEGGPSTEETPADEFIWTDQDDEDEQGLSGAEAQPAGPYETPEFRELQSRSDQRISALQAQLSGRDDELARLKAEQRKIQDALDADKMRNATPQQIHAHYQQRAARDAADQAALADGQALEGQIGARASGLLQAVGMTHETPGLRFIKHDGVVDLRSYADLLESVVEVQHKRGTPTGQEAAATQAAPAAPPPQAGTPPTPAVGALPVTRGRVSTARGRRPVSLWSSYYKELDKLAPGQPFEVVKLRKEYEKRGLDFSKMPKRRRR